jgi:CheY-like chemotaxis protein
VVKHAGVTSAVVELSKDSAQHDYFRLVVEDQGRGFDASVLFGEMAWTGSGFGLTSIRERLALLGGALEVESEVGYGARFTIIAPMRKEHPSADGDSTATHYDARSSLEPPLRDPSDGATIRVLLTDDHAVMRQGLRSLLGGELDIEIVAEASDGVEALEIAGTVHPDVVLMDFSMPRMDGVEATRRIRAELPHIQVIGLSMYDEADRAAAMIDAGAAAYLSKSGSADVLIKTIRNAYRDARISRA